MVDPDRFSELERQVAELKQKNEQKAETAVLKYSWADFKEMAGACQELAREARREAKRQAEIERAERFKREAPARRRREKEIASLEGKVAKFEAEIAEIDRVAEGFREQIRVLRERPLEGVPS